MSSTISAVGGAPIFTGTSGAPVGSVSLTATHGLPFADDAAAAVDGEVPKSALLDVEPPLLPHAASRAAPAIRAARDQVLRDDGIGANVVGGTGPVARGRR